VSIASDSFSRTFGDALQAFLDAKEITYAAAARKLGVERATLGTYWKDNEQGKRPKPRAELLFRACRDLGFEFEYNGYRITVEVLGKPTAREEAPKEQLHHDFSRQFTLTEDDGQVTVKLKRHPGTVEFSVSLKAAS
jgi:transcriptional regulator with XRE-family HTH domain